MKVESIAECWYSAMLLTCMNRKSVLKTSFGVLFDWLLKTGFTVVKMETGVHIVCKVHIPGFPQALEIMENLENHEKSSMHGKIMEFAKT